MKPIDGGPHKVEDLYTHPITGAVIRVTYDEALIDKLTQKEREDIDAIIRKEIWI